jgi:hypothetical protein
MAVTIRLDYSIKEWPIRKCPVFQVTKTGYRSSKQLETQCFLETWPPI